MVLPSTVRRRAIGRTGLIGAVGVLVALAPHAGAATYTPTKTGDHSPNGCSAKDCTLREAITRANEHGGPDTVVLRAGRTYTLSQENLAGDEDANATGDLDVLGRLTIRSESHTPATVDANGVDRVFEVGTSTPVSATFKRVTIRGGEAGSTSRGGGIDSEYGGTLNLIRSRVVHNQTQDDGGGIYAYDRLMIKRSLIAHNKAGGAGGGLINFGMAKIKTSTISSNRAESGVGGGLHNGNDASLILTSSTVNGNVAAASDGGGIENYGEATLTNDTITKNRSAGYGGGFESDSNDPARLNAVTIARNSASSGGGIDGVPITISNSLVALNSASSLGPDCHPVPTIVSGGHNLIGDPTDCEGNFGGATHDITNVNPMIGLLAANGGPTKTLALLHGSKAINNAGSGAPKRDQRAVRRNDPDIGAFERR